MGSGTDTTNRALELSRRLRAETDPRAVLQQLLAAAVTEIPGAAHAGISTLTTALLGSDATARHLESCQHGSGGPGPRAAAEEDLVRSKDLARETRWPEFAPAACEEGVRSAVAIPVLCVGESGALTLYSRRARSFGAAAQQFALQLAAQAAGAAAVREQEHLRTAAASRDVIGQAKGMLMERYRIGAGAAFDLLSRVSQSTNRKLRAVAEDLVLGAEFPAHLPEPRQAGSTP